MCMIVDVGEGRGGGGGGGGGGEGYFTKPCPSIEVRTPVSKACKLMLLRTLSLL